MIEKRFRVLRVIATIAKILGWIGLAVGLLVSLGILIAALSGSASTAQAINQLISQTQGRGGSPQVQWLSTMLGGLVFLVGLILTVSAFLLTLLYFLLSYGAGEVIYLFLAIEENTRTTSTWIGRWLQAPIASPKG